MEQWPEAGTEVEEGSKVNLYRQYRAGEPGHSSDINQDTSPSTCRWWMRRTLSSPSDVMVTSDDGNGSL